jgi:hypothetical protein
VNSYLLLSRTHSYSLLFALPLLALYELGALWLSSSGRTGLRNGADVLLRTLLAAGGVQGTAAFTGALLAVAAVFIVVERRRRSVPLRGRVFAGMLAESAAYALAFGAVIGTATYWLLRGAGLRLAIDGVPVAQLPLPEAIVLSLGAGFYEEVVFRVLLAGGLFAIFRGSGLERTRAGVFAAVLSALVFSAFHYVGPYGDPWELGSFLFRALAGLAFSALFLVRGFGITAWTHALYDVFLFLARGH